MRWARPSVGLDASPTGLQSLAFSRDPRLVSGHPGRGRSRPWPMAPCLVKKPEDSKRVTGSLGPGLQFPWSERGPGSGLLSVSWSGCPAGGAVIPTLVVDPDLRPALLSDLVEARGEVEEATGPEQRANSEARGRV